MRWRVEPKTAAARIY